MESVTFDDVAQAAERLHGSVLETPCVPSYTLSQVLGCEVFLKFENLQFTASFKERGALNKLLQLTPHERAAGVVAASAGNHAQGVAFHAQRLGVPAVIVMPRFTPSIKVENTRAYGAQIVLEGETLTEARAHAQRLARERAMAFVHPYDDPAVIAGQGSIAIEMLRQVPALDALAISVGGGGLIAGIAAAAARLQPGLEVVGVQTDRFPAMYNAFHGSDCPGGVSTVAEGIAVQEPGQITRELIARHVADMLLVDEGDIEQAIVMLLEIEKTVVEGAGAAGLAALLRHPRRFAGRRVGLVLSGGNIDPLMLAGIIRRGMVRAGRLSRLRIDISDRPGSLANLTALLGRAGANIEEITHQRAFSSLSVERTEVEIVIHTRGPAHVKEILDALSEAGYRVERFQGVARHDGIAS
ncbi:MAG TPA: threonine ammonia-lyase [Burkholderiaceae bacterium]|nr:threonine ammonia-lyase [Burkholderiaceae bacterium]